MSTLEKRCDKQMAYWDLGSCEVTGSVFDWKDVYYLSHSETMIEEEI